MPLNDPPLAFPSGDVPGGRRDVWDDGDAAGEVRAALEEAERRLLACAERTRRRMMAERKAEEQRRAQARMPR
jgi:hypothetical protein